MIGPLRRVAGQVTGLLSPEKSATVDTLDGDEEGRKRALERRHQVRKIARGYSQRGGISIFTESATPGCSL